MQPAGTIATPDRSYPPALFRPLEPPPSLGSPTERKRRRLGLAGAAQQALDDRRLFVLLPFAIVAGLIASLGGNAQPEPLALAAVGIGAQVAGTEAFSAYPSFAAPAGAEQLGLCAVLALCILLPFADRRGIAP